MTEEKKKAKKKTVKKAPKANKELVEALTMLKYLAKHEKNQRVIDFLTDRGIDYS